MISTTQRKISQSHGLVTVCVLFFIFIPHLTIINFSGDIAWLMINVSASYGFFIFFNHQWRRRGLNEKHENLVLQSYQKERISWLGRTGFVPPLHYTHQFHFFCAYPICFVFSCYHIPPLVLETHHLVVDYLCLPMGSLLLISNLMY